MTELRHTDGIGKKGERVKFTCASGPVLVEDGKVLVNKHGEDEFWKFPGGSVHDEFNLMENAIREVKEECGVEIEIVEKKPCFLIFEREYEGCKEYVFLIHYLAKRKRGSKIVKGEGIRETGWLDIENLPKDIAPNIRPVLEFFKKLGKI